MNERDIQEMLDLAAKKREQARLLFLSVPGIETEAKLLIAGAKALEANATEARQILGHTDHSNELCEARR